MYQYQHASLNLRVETGKLYEREYHGKAAYPKMNDLIVIVIVIVKCEDNYSLNQLIIPRSVPKYNISSTNTPRIK